MELVINQISLLVPINMLVTTLSVSLILGFIVFKYFVCYKEEEEKEKKDCGSFSLEENNLWFILA